jgi:two-component system chemotaxis response regulator CheY
MARARPGPARGGLRQLTTRRPLCSMSHPTEVCVVFLVVESSLTVRESLCYVLLSFGVRGIPLANRKAAQEALEKGEKIDGAIVDIDNKEVDGMELVAELKRSEETRGASVIVHTIQTSKDVVMRMVDLGVAGYLLKPYNPDQARSKLASIFSKLATHNSQRRHIRVKPNPDELARVSFRLGKSSSLISGRIVDISLGGLAAELFNPPEKEPIEAGTPLFRTEISLAGKVLTPSASAVLYKSNVLAAKFDILNPNDKKALERYIFKSISS